VRRPGCNIACPGNRANGGPADHPDCAANPMPVVTPVPATP
jgi:hypothetical protein